MAAKTRLKYETDEGQVSLILLDPARAAVAGTPPAGDVDTGIRAKVSKGNREFGIRPRGVRLARTVGTAPDTFVKYSFLPVLTATQLVSAAFALGTTITIDGVDWEVVGRVQEDY